MEYGGLIERKAVCGSWWRIEWCRQAKVKLQVMLLVLYSLDGLWVFLVGQSVDMTSWTLEYSYPQPQHDHRNYFSRTFVLIKNYLGKIILSSQTVSYLSVSFIALFSKCNIFSLLCLTFLNLLLNRYKNRQCILCPFSCRVYNLA